MLQKTLAANGHLNDGVVSQLLADISNAADDLEDELGQHLFEEAAIKGNLVCGEYIVSP